MPTRKKPRIPGGPVRDAINKQVKSAAAVILENLEARKVGRPAKYHDGFPHIAEQCCLINSDSPGLADMFGCGTEQIGEWQKAYHQFSQAIARGKAKTDEEVERSLVHRAKGYSHPDIHFTTEMTGKGYSKTVQIPITKHYPPDTHAATFWLKNRKPKDYRPDAQLAPGGPPLEDAARLLREAMAKINDATSGDTDA